MDLEDIKYRKRRLTVWAYHASRDVRRNYWFDHCNLSYSGLLNLFSSTATLAMASATTIYSTKYTILQCSWQFEMNACKFQSANNVPRITKRPMCENLPFPFAMDLLIVKIFRRDSELCVLVYIQSKTSKLHSAAKPLAI